MARVASIRMDRLGEVNKGDEVRVGIEEGGKLQIRRGGDLRTAISLELTAAEGLSLLRKIIAG